MLRDARQEAHNIISEAKEIADSTIREYNKLKKQNKNPDANKKMEHMRSDLRGRMTKLEGQMAYKSKKKNKKRHEANDFHVGDEHPLNVFGQRQLQRIGTQYRFANGYYSY